ncbi:MAG: DUF4054 domain-containing protein [Pseudomonadota bacterium]
MARLEFFRQQAKEFSNLPDSVVVEWFASTLVYLDSYLSSISPAKLELAIALYAAHLCWLEKYPGQGGASRGPILLEKDDKKSKEYELLKNSNTWLGQSHYGQSFINLTGIFGPTRAAILTRFGTH